MAPVLYTIETNVSFPAETADTALVCAVAAEFGVPRPMSVTQVMKRNVASKLYRVEAVPVTLMLRAVPSDAAGPIERQCEVAADLPFRNIIKPRRSRAGRYVADLGGQAWMAYPAVDGDIYDGRNCSPAMVIEGVIGLLDALAQVGDDGLSDTRHRPALWGETFELLSSLALASSQPAIADALSTGMIDAIRENRAALLSWTYTARDIAGGFMACAVHNDLNHANVVIAGGSPCFLDLEDIVSEDPRVAFGHAAFKVARHAVYTGAVSADGLREEFVPWLKQRVAGTRYEDFFPYARLRIISDVAEIVFWQIEQGDPSQLHDLEKRLANLFELEDLFGGAFGPAA
jgi:hypothetical protein